MQDSAIDPERFTIEWVSSAEAPRFADVVTQFTQKIKALGPIQRQLHAVAANS